jgi:hypothetical protein
MNPVRISPTNLAAAIVLGAALLPACHHSVPVSNDPTQPIYRKADADFSKFQAVKYHFVSITTSNNEGADLVRSAFEESLKHEFAPHFKTVAEGDSAGSGELLMNIALDMNWGNRAGRYWSMGMGGKAIIDIKYDVRDSGGNELAKLDRKDTFSGVGQFGGDSRALAFNAADKWNKWFVANVLFPAGASAPK